MKGFHGRKFEQFRGRRGWHHRHRHRRRGWRGGRRRFRDWKRRENNHGRGLRHRWRWRGRCQRSHLLLQIFGGDLVERTRRHLGGGNAQLLGFGEHELALQSESLGDVVNADGHECFRLRTIRQHQQTRGPSVHRKTIWLCCGDGGSPSSLLNPGGVNNCGGLGTDLRNRRQI